MTAVLLLLLLFACYCCCRCWLSVAVAIGLVHSQMGGVEDWEIWWVGVDRGQWVGVMEVVEAAA